MCEDPFSGFYGVYGPTPPCVCMGSDSDESDDSLEAIGYSHWSEGDSFTTWGYSRTSERFTQASTFDSASFEEAATYTGNSANTQTPLNEEADDTSSPIVHAITSNPMPAQM